MAEVYKEQSSRIPLLKPVEMEVSKLYIYIYIYIYYAFLCNACNTLVNKLLDTEKFQIRSEGQGRSCTLDGISDRLERPSVLWNAKIHCTWYRNPSAEPMIDPVPVLDTYIFNAISMYISTHFRVFQVIYFKAFRCVLNSHSFS